jgi:two-component system chemotaxis sensor kinase CheA
LPRARQTDLKFRSLLSDKENVDDLTREFLLESQEGLDRMERCLTDLESRPGDGELLAEIFRAVHTIKGTTGFLGFGRLEALSHAGENLLGLLRDGRMAPTPEIVTGLLALMDKLREVLRAIESSGAEGESGEEDRILIAGLEALQRGGTSAAQAEAEMAVVAAAAAPARARRRRSPGKKAAVRRQGSPAPVTAGQAGPRSETDAVPPVTISPAEAFVSSRPASEAEPGPAQQSAAESTLRVDIELLNRMMNLVGELVLTRNQILQATAAQPGFSQLGRRLDMVTADLRESVMKARMQPVSHVFSRFTRLVRDLSQNLGKRVRLELEGQETELDKGLLEAIRDPLTHAVRNAIDHGIELPAVRSARGKPEEGLLRLRACHEGSNVIVEVHDDGAGMNIARIREKAIERQLVTAARAGQMSEREVLQLIFLPGFSTAAAVTSVSGRGVGMDVVRTNVEKIGGKVEIDSRAGEGTVLRLRIPLTLAIISALIVRTSGQKFALPQSALDELVHLGRGEHSRIEWLENAPLCRLRGHLLPLIFLDRLLQQPAREVQMPCDIAVLNADGRRFGLVVDGLADPEEIVVKPLSAVLREIGFYAGATILGNGEMALILTPSAIALKAGIGLTAAGEEATVVVGGRSGRSEYLLVEVDGHRAAVPLENVVRIERVSRSRIELAGAHPVLRFERMLLPLNDAARSLAGGDSEEQATVIVCRDGERHVGMMVSQVLDVDGGEALLEAGSGANANGMTLLQDRVTGVVNLAQISSLDPHSGADWPAETMA